MARVSNVVSKLVTIYTIFTIGQSFGYRKTGVEYSNYGIKKVLEFHAGIIWLSAASLQR